MPCALAYNAASLERHTLTSPCGRTAEPRLIVTDALGRRIVPIDKPVFTIGRRSETDLRLSGADISRVHAEIVARAAASRVLHDRQSRFGTFVNDEKVDRARAGARRSASASGKSSDVEIVFAIGEDAPSAEKSAASAATELRQMAALLEGLRALGSGRVLDEVLALVLDSAIEVTGAERGFIMLANREGAARVHAGARARQGDAVGPHVRDQPQDSRAGVRHRQAPRSSRICWTTTSRRCTAGTVALGIRHVLCTPLRLVRYVERADDKPDDETIGVLYLDSRERGALGSAVVAVGARNAVGRSRPRDRERAALPRGARQGEVRAGAQGRGRDSAGAAAGRARRQARSSRRAAPRRRASPSAATSSTTSICRPASSASSSATWPARDRRRRCWRRPSSACSAPSRRIR